MVEHVKPHPIRHHRKGMVVINKLVVKSLFVVVIATTTLLAPNFSMAGTRHGSFRLEKSYYLRYRYYKDCRRHHRHHRFVMRRHLQKFPR